METPPTSRLLTTRDLVNRARRRPRTSPSGVLSQHVQVQFLGLAQPLDILGMIDDMVTGTGVDKHRQTTSVHAQPGYQA